MSYSIGFDIFAKDRASGTFDKLGNKVESTEGKFAKHKAAIVAGAAVAGAAIVRFGADSIGAYKDAEAQQRKLTDAYSRFPALADVSIDSMRDLAQAQQAKTKFDGDDVAGSMAVLAQYKLTGSQIQDLTPLMLDYAEKTGKDLPTAAKDLGKALGGQGRALKAVGINFKDAKDPTKNYEQLMGGLRKQVGGFATKEGKSAEGRAEILKNKFGDLQENVGGKLVPAMTKLTDAGIKMLGWMEKNPSKVKAIAIGFGALVTVMLVAKAITVAQTAAMTVMAARSAVIATATKLWAAAQWLMNAALTANPIGIVIVLIAALVGGLILAYKKSETFRAVVKGAFEAISNAAKFMWNNVVAPVIRFLLNAFASVAGFYATMLRGLSKVPGFGWAKTAADKLDTAGRKARELATGVRNIPSHKKVVVTVEGRVTSGRLTVNGKKVNIGMFAKGGHNLPKGWRVVGEEGPELQYSPGGDSVIPAGATKKFLGGGRPGSMGGSGGDTYNVILGPGSVREQALQFIQEVKKIKRQTGVDPLNA